MADHLHSTRKWLKHRDPSPKGSRQTPLLTSTFDPGICRLSGHFETLAFSKNEDDTRVRLLDTCLAQHFTSEPKTVAHGPHSHGKILRGREAEVTQLRYRLRLGLLTPEPQPTLASSLYMREVRAETIGALVKAVTHLADADLRVVTVINRKWLLKAVELDNVRAATIKGRFRTHLHRAGVLGLPGLLVAFLHGEFEPTSGTYQLHFHLLTTKKKAAAILEGLRGRWGYEKTASGAAPIKRQKVRDRASQFSYLLKAYWPEKPVLRIDGRRRRVRAGRRIKGPYHTQYLIWLHQHSLADMVLANKCIVRDGTIYAK